MKNLLLILLVCLCASSAFAQTQTIRANLDAVTTVEMTVRMEGNIAYIHRSSVPFDATAQHGIHNLAGVEFGEGRFVIPDDGQLYWLVPLDGQKEPEPVYGYLTYCFKCICTEQGKCHVAGRTCELTSSCGSCLLILYPCGIGPVHKPIGAFAVVKATKLVTE